MNAQEFAYWLKGFVEMNPAAMVTETQWQIMKDHLELVFKKETPLRFSAVPGITDSIFRSATC